MLNQIFYRLNSIHFTSSNQRHENTEYRTCSLLENTLQRMQHHKRLSASNRTSKHVMPKYHQQITYKTTIYKAKKQQSFKLHKRIYYIIVLMNPFTTADPSAVKN